jgi:ferric-dicitrate binding protein FerR (iron transport regulator)
MKEESLIRKWLDYDLTTEELKVFEGSEDFQTLEHISNIAKGVRAPEFDAATSLASLSITKQQDAPKRSFNFATLAKIAAVLVITLGVFYYTSTLDTSITTQLAKTETIVLPDNSAVVINADSELRYNKSSWNAHRNLTLDGEAYFKVAKGEKFTVATQGGSITVLGTAFNVRYRNNKLEVACFEGSVKVNAGSSSIILAPTNKVIIENDKITKRYVDKDQSPSWVEGESTFVSMPFIDVIREFERQYDVSIETQNIDVAVLFTGGFKHHDIVIAMQTISSPMQLTYTKEGKKMILSSE